MPFIRAGDLTVHYDLAGPAEAPVVMLANSLGTNFHMWDAQVPALAQHFRVLRYDMRGHGMSDGPAAGTTGYSIDALAQDALDLLDALGIGGFHFCGLSIGGMVGQRLGAKAKGRIASLVLCDTGSRIGPPKLWDDRIAAIRSKGLEGVADAVISRWFTPRFFSERADEARGYRNMLVRTSVEGYVGCGIAVRDADLRADDAQIACPTLVVVGADDAATPPSSAREISEAVKGAQLVVLDNAAHIPAVEQPEALNRVLLDFLGQHAGRQ
jgi:3-oxoadipate enol-lactonase